MAENQVYHKFHVNIARECAMKYEASVDCFAASPHDTIRSLNSSLRYTKAR